MHNMLLTKAKVGQTLNVSRIEGEEKVKRFLFSLGCFEGQQITLVSILAGNYVINIKDSRYAIDEGVAKSIVVEA